MRVCDECAHRHHESKADFAGQSGQPGGDFGGHLRPCAPGNGFCRSKARPPPFAVLCNNCYTKLLRIGVVGRDASGRQGWPNFRKRQVARSGAATCRTSTKKVAARPASKPRRQLNPGSKPARAAPPCSAHKVDLHPFRPASAPVRDRRARWVRARPACRPSSSRRSFRRWGAGPAATPLSGFRRIP